MNDLTLLLVWGAIVVGVTVLATEVRLRLRIREYRALADEKEREDREEREARQALAAAAADDSEDRVYAMGDRVLVSTGHRFDDIWVRGEFAGLTERAVGRNGDMTTKWLVLVRLTPGGNSAPTIAVHPGFVEHDDDGVEVVIGYRDLARDVN